MTTLYMKAVRAVPLLNGIWLEKGGDFIRAADVLGRTRDPAEVDGEPALGKNEYVLFLKDKHWRQQEEHRAWWASAVERGLIEKDGRMIEKQGDR